MLEKANKIIRLKRSMYVVSPNESNKLLSLELIANHIYGSSYVSRETALRYCIPCCKKKAMITNLVKLIKHG